MSTCIYNGVTINNVLTESVDQTPIYNGKDPIGLRVSLNCRGIVYVSSVSANTVLGIKGTSSLGLTLDDVMSKLNTPKRRLQFQVGTYTLFDVAGYAAAGPTSKPDLDHGPKPSARFVNFVSDKTAMLHFRIEFTIWMECKGDGRGRITNFKFWQGDSISEDWYTTRTYQGMLRVSDVSVNPHLFREVCLPPLVPGFVRERIELQESQDGLELHFQIVDQEQFAVPPAPSTTWEASHTISFPRPGLNYAESEMNLRLRGSKDVPQEQLYFLAFNILAQRLHVDDKVKDGRNFVQSLTFRDNLKNGAIEASARVLHMGMGVFAGVQRTFMKPLTLPGYVPDIMPHPRPTATLSGLFYQAVSQTPCNPVTQPYSAPLSRFTYRLNTKDPKGGKRQKAPRLSMADLPLKVATPAAQSYGQYEIESDVKTNTGQVFLPIAKSSTAGATTRAVALMPAQTRRVLKIFAERLGAWPEIPDQSEFTDYNGILHRPIRHQPKTNEPQVAADGHKVLYSTNAEIEYQLDRAPTSSETILAGLPPYVGSQLVSGALRGAEVFVKAGASLISNPQL